MRLRQRVRERLQTVLPAIVYDTMMAWWKTGERELARRPAARERRRRGEPVPTIDFHPGMPTQFSLVTKLCNHLGLPMRHRDTGGDLAVAWCLDTHWQPADALVARGAVNHACTDISKDRVNEAFLATFHRPVGVDPREHRGPLVEKSNDNALHDGEIVDGPLEPRPGRTYQRLIDNVTDDGAWVLDLRVPVVGGSIPLLYERRRPVDRRFRSGNERAVLVAVEDHLDDTERAQLLALAAEMGLEMGEMDVLRHRADGLLYVVDVNPTPWGPPSGISAEDGTRAVEILSEAFWTRVVRPRIAS